MGRAHALLRASPPPCALLLAAGVACGATFGHFMATLVAVVGGSMMSKRISERTVGIASGVLFLVFAAATLLGVF